MITPGNIDDLYDVYRYTHEPGLEFAAAPQLLGVRAHPDLVGSPAYPRLYDFLIARKRARARGYGTVRYLESLRDLGKFDCRPFTMLVVSPVGDVHYPCLEGGKIVANLLDETDLHAIRRRARQPLGPGPECDSQCHSACMLGFSLALRHPGALIVELLRHLARSVRTAS